MVPPVIPEEFKRYGAENNLLKIVQELFLLRNEPEGF
jgi:hypothetical protein